MPVSSGASAETSRGEASCTDTPTPAKPAAWSVCSSEPGAPASDGASTKVASKPVPDSQSLVDRFLSLTGAALSPVLGGCPNSLDEPSRGCAPPPALYGARGSGIPNHTRASVLHPSAGPPRQPAPPDPGPTMLGRGVVPWHPRYCGQSLAVGVVLTGQLDESH